MSKARELKSLIEHPGWKHLDEYMLGVQAMKFNLASKEGASTEDVLKAIGCIDGFKKFYGWIQASIQQDSEV